MQRCRERIVDEPEVAALRAKADFEHVQLTIAHVTNGHGLLRDAAVDFAKVRGTGDGNLARGNLF
jgi:hypothetical protein